MFVKDLLGEIPIKTQTPDTRFLFMFLGVVTGILTLFATRVHDYSVLQQPSLAWSFLTIAMFLMVSIAIGGRMFWRKTSRLSILTALPLLAPRRK